MNRITISIIVGVILCTVNSSAKYLGKEHESSTNDYDTTSATPTTIFTASSKQIDIDNVNNLDTTTTEQIKNEYNEEKEDKLTEINNSHLKHESSKCMYRPPTPNECKISAVDKYMNAKIIQMIEKERITLIEYNFHFPNYSYNPFIFNATFYHKPHIWSRTSTTYGQTLLSLAFNYGILSLMTLTFGTSKIKVNLTDSPYGCFGNLPEMNKMVVIRELAMRDFLSVSDLDEENKTNNADVQSDSRICHEVVENENGYAKFADCCCYADIYSSEKVCNNSSQNSWLTFLYILLSIVRYCIFLFGPLLFLSTMTDLARDEFPYTVKLNDKLEKTVYFCRTDQDVSENLKYELVLDFRHKHGFPKLKDSLTLASKKIDEFWENKNGGSINNEQGIIKEVNDCEHLLEEKDKSNSRETLESKTNLEKNEFELPKSLYKCPVKIRISEYDILINYKRLVTENDVSIGFWKTISNMIFLCRLRNVGPFQECCKVNMFKHTLCLRNRPTSWLSFWKIIGSILMVILLPLPYYIRLWVLYRFEIEEITSRKGLISTLGLKERFENSLLHYFLPDHFLFVFIYIVYVLLAVCFVAMPENSEDEKTKQVVVNSFTDLKNLSWVDVLHMLVSNVIWPFKQFGVLGFLVALVYWPIVIPLSMFVFCMYCLPTLFLTARMLFYSRKAFSEKRIKRSRRAYRVNRKADNNLRSFYVENITKKCIDNGDLNDLDKFNNNDIEVEDRNENKKTKLMKQSSKISDVIDIDEVDHFNPSRLSRFRTRSASLASSIVKFDDNNKVCHILGQILVSIACVVVLYSILIILTECLGSLVDMLVFTMMGIIVNAGNLLKYIALIIMIVVYSYDSFNNVEKKYLKLNKALFTEVKSRIKDLDKVTSLPSYLQENRGFKSQELNEQAEYERPDNVWPSLPRHWFINDLVLFVDNEDMPRIPKKLFENVCEIKVAGVPGPVYSGLILALKQFLKIVTFIVFVFIVVLTFGSVYEVSNTNQMLAALAGGSLPFILRTFMEPEKPEIEMGTVSFKSKLDEVIKNFSQVWPMYDFDFQLYEPEEEDDEGSEMGDKKKEKKERKDSLSKLRKSSDSKQERKVSMPNIIAPESGRNFPISYSSDNIFPEYTSDTHHTTVIHEPKANHKAVVPTKSNHSAKVCFQEPVKESYDKVDIVILIPEEFTDLFDDFLEPFVTTTTTTT